MQERQKIITEYFELIVRLNRANKLPNESTELTFEITQSAIGISHFRAKLSGITTSILLSEWTKMLGWQPLGFSGFSFLENFIAIQLDEVQHQLQIENMTVVTTSQRILIISFIKENLGRLGIPKG